MRLDGIAVLGLCLVGCDGKGDDSGSAEDLAMAEDLWAAMDGYQDWDAVPGHEGVVASSSPHGPFVQAWLNDAASATIAAGSGGAMPAGAIIVKEGYDDEAGSSLRSVTAMQKVAGYDADHGDWFFAVFAEDGTVSKAGQETATYCTGCHQSGQDYVLITTW